MDNPSIYDLLENFYFDYHEIYDQFSNVIRILGNLSTVFSNDPNFLNNFVPLFHYAIN